MDKTKQFKTAAALASVALFISLLKHSTAGVIGVVVFLVAMAFDMAAVRWIITGWEKLTHFIGQVLTKVLLTVIFYLLFTPLSWLFRLFNKKLVAKFFSTGDESYFLKNPEDITPAFFERMW